MATKKKTTEPASEGIERGIRQSAPKQMPIDLLPQLQSEADLNSVNDGAVDGFVALSAPIGKEAINKANLILQKYKEGKSNLEKRIVENEQWYKLRHWECMRKSETSQVEPTSAWLFNALANKHADAMDNFPSPNILPREEGDKAEAKKLSSIVPVVLEQANFEETYDDEMNYKLKSGTGAYGVFWDSEKNGIGDIEIVGADLLQLFWESGVKDIQKSKNFFHVELVDNEELISKYPQLNGKLGANTVATAKYIYDDTVDTTDKSCLVDWYYKKVNSQGKQILHYVKYVNDEVLFATENDPVLKERGLYDHGQYPFVFDPLFKVEGTPAGFGYIDVAKSAQEYIDRGNQAFMQNLLSNTKPRYFIRNDGTVREEEYADINNDFIHVDGNLGQDAIQPVEGKLLSNIYVDVIANKIEELKEVTGNRDVATGGTTGGVTAGSAIASMQEAGSKLSRDNNKASYRAFRKIVYLVIELIRQFYDLPRQFRIIGENGAEEFITYNNQGIVPQQQGIEFGVDLGLRTPLFDIEVTAEKQSPYSKMAQNELALQFYSAGFFNPQMADQALICLDMMDFDRKDAIMQKIAQNGTMYQMILQLQQQMMALGGMVDGMRGGNEITASLASQFGMGQPMPQGAPNAGSNEALGGSANKESKLDQKARQRYAESTAPR